MNLALLQALQHQCSQIWHNQIARNQEFQQRNHNISVTKASETIVLYYNIHIQIRWYTYKSACMALQWVVYQCKVAHYNTHWTTSYIITVLCPHILYISKPSISIIIDHTWISGAKNHLYYWPNIIIIMHAYSIYCLLLQAMKIQLYIICIHNHANNIIFMNITHTKALIVSRSI